MHFKVDLKRKPEKCPSFLKNIPTSGHEVLSIPPPSTHCSALFDFFVLVLNIHNITIIDTHLKEKVRKREETHSTIFSIKKICFN